MLKQLVILTLSVLMLCSVGEARKKKAKAGTVKDSVYVDNDYGLKMAVPEEGWKPSIHKGDTPARLTLLLEDFKADAHMSQALVKSPSDLFKNVPAIQLWVIESPVPPNDLLDSLLLDKSDSKLKGPLFEFLQPNYSEATFQKTKGGAYAKSNAAMLEGYSWQGSFEYKDIDFGFEVSVGAGLLCLKADDKHCVLFIAKSDPELIKVCYDRSTELAGTLKWTSAGE
ncbi:MAG: hypothetical protein ABIE70_05050 [bacterium]